MTLGALAFLNPWLLGALATLPLIYWLLRAVPPRPSQIAFPPTRILVGMESADKTPAKTPWWMLLMRLLAAALVIFALAEPLLNPAREQALSGDGPIAIVVDNGWASAPGWADRQRMIERTIANAEAVNKAVIVVPTAPTTQTFALRIEAPGDARTTAAALTPQPFPPKRAEAIAALRAVLTENNATAGQPNVVWLTDGIDHSGKTTDFAKTLGALADGGTLSVVENSTDAEPLGLAAGLGAGGKLVATVKRAAGGVRSGVLHAYSARNQRLGEAEFTLDAGAREAKVTFELPLELRNQVTRVVIAGSQSAGAIALLDARSQRQRIALLSGENLEQAQPLLASLYYIEKALSPYAEIVKPRGANLAAGVAQALDQNATIMIMADIGTLTGAVRDRVADWVQRGGVLVRFAGPRLENGGDDLLPVPLRQGGRTLGGALSWSTPQALNGFEDTSLFAGLTPPSDVRINRQVLADPTALAIDTIIWARLQDGTPLVTADQRGEGQLILFHVTANSDWSNLPISGLFVEMLQRVATLGGNVTAAANDVGASAAPGSAGISVGGAETAAPANASGTSTILSAQQTLDGFGSLVAPPPTAQTISTAGFAQAKASLEHPPGYYGSGGRPRTINVIDVKTELRPLPDMPSGAQRVGYKSEAAEPLKPWLLAIAFALILADILAVLILQAGGLKIWQRPVSAAAAVLLVTTAALGLVLAGLSGPANAQEPTDQQFVAPQPAPSNVDVETAARATGKVTFGYVTTGDGQIDEASRAGLAGLATVLRLRTAVTPGEPIAVNILTDEIAFYPVLYWPLTTDARPLPEPVLGKIDAYMKQGGLVIFDTRDYGSGIPQDLLLDSSGSSPLQRLLGRLDLPPLEPVPEGHVMTKSFYLLNDFPGRWDGGKLWVEAGSVAAEGQDTREARKADGVTSIMITSNDFASAWALDSRGIPLYPVVPGGEDQREMAFRTGINIVMHALTGNYKADQVHVPALLNRLGQ